MTNQVKIGDEMDKTLKIRLHRIIVSTILLVIALILPPKDMISIGLYLCAYFIVGYDVLYKAIKHLFTGQLLDENFLMSLATIGALFLGEYLESVMVMLLYQVGELFQSYAVGKSRTSISSLMDIRPDYANIEKNGKLEKMNPEDIKIGDIIIVKPGEKIPLDGIVQEGESYLDTSRLTGESVPYHVKVKDTVLSGSVNQNGLLKIEVIKEFAESTASKILDLVEHASSRKAKAENFITKFSHYYTPIVVIGALLLAILPPLLFPHLTFKACLSRAFTFLVISCPCALVISVPLGFFGGLGGASRRGILLKGSNYLETVSRLKTIVFDKTGTLTKGTFQVTKVIANHISDDELLKYAAQAELYSNHPIAISIKEKYPHVIVQKDVKQIEEVSGKGVHVQVLGEDVYAGNHQYMQDLQITVPEVHEGTVVYIVKERSYLGYVVISDEIKENAKESLENLKQQQIHKMVMLTGDSKESAKSIAEKLPIDSYYASLLPQDKLERVEVLMKESDTGPLSFVGDGMNDAPVLVRADIGIAMGGLGSDAAIEAADVVIMDDDLSKIGEAIGIAKRTIRIVKQNIVFAIGIKIFFLVLGAFGFANMLEAVFADVGVSVLAILNSMRTLNVNHKKKMNG